MGKGGSGATGRGGGTNGGVKATFTAAAAAALEERCGISTTIPMTSAATRLSAGASGRHFVARPSKRRPLLLLRLLLRWCSIFTSSTCVVSSASSSSSTARILGIACALACQKILLDVCGRFAQSRHPRGMRRCTSCRDAKDYYVVGIPTCSDYSIAHESREAIRERANCRKFLRLACQREQWTVDVYPSK